VRIADEKVRSRTGHAETHQSPLISVRVPELGAFAIPKGAVFRKRPDAARMAKDSHYIVELMQSGKKVSDKLEMQIVTYCEAKDDAVELARQAKNLIGLVIREPDSTPVRRALAQARAVRPEITVSGADAKARGFLGDFADPPGDCGRTTTLR
jgi:hypothetical protein